MSHLKSLQRRLKAYEVPDSIQIWKDIVRLAVTSNTYPIDDEIRVLLYLKLDMFHELMEWADAISQQMYEKPMLHYRMHQLAALIRKYPLPDHLSGYHPKRTAQLKFQKAEHRCKRINQRFRAQRTCNRDPMPLISWHAAEWIRYVLRDLPSLDRIYKGCSFTPGAAIGVHGNATNLARKLQSHRWSVTPSALPYALGAMWSNDHIREFLLSKEGEIYSVDKDLFRQNALCRVSLVRYNKISFVPKTAKTHRSIAVEPLLNSFVQKGIDEEMRLRLKRVGLDLADQSRNSEMARQGSFDESNGYCTIDLSSASDTIALEVVRWLLPNEWYDLLYAVRSPAYQLEGVTHSYHKFASMGNGFCFPLETLIFASLCHACYAEMRLKPDFRVYGDDIIVRKEVFDRLLEVLKHFGFELNSRKTFGSGSFRESCGKDWHTGVNVRPLFISDTFKSLGSLMNFHNESIRREAYVQDYFAEIREYLFKLVPTKVRLVSYFDPRRDASIASFDDVPPDGAFWVPLDTFMASPLTRWNTSYQTWTCPRLVSKASTDYRWLRRNGAELQWFGHNTVLLMGALSGSKSSSPFTLRYSAGTKLSA